MTVESSIQFQKLLPSLEKLWGQPGEPTEKWQSWETRITGVVRKWLACDYHKSNVAQHKLSYFDKVEGGLNTENVLGFGTEVDAIAHELSAFMAAIKSGADFLAGLCFDYHLDGKHGDSTKAILRLLKRNDQLNPLLEVWRESEEWLTESREYRHPLIHRVSPRIIGGGKNKESGGIRATAIYPIIVPEKPIKREPDTRLSRTFEDPINEPIGMITGSTKSEVSDQDGKNQVVDYNLSAAPATGYLEIEDFMERQLLAFEKLTIGVVNLLAESNFQSFR